jgi:hypothetical protein
MSNQSTTDELRQVEDAIDLRALGYSWGEVAKRLGLEAKEIRKWPHQYAEVWARRLAAAHRDLDAETIGEARAILRFHLRTEDLKVACDVARVLLDHARRSQVPPAETAPARNSVFHQIADYLEGLSDVERNAFLADKPVEEPKWAGDEGLLPGHVQVEDGRQ